MIVKQHIILLCRRNTQGMAARESSTSYNTKETEITRKPTLMDQIAQEEKQVFAAEFADIARRGANQKKQPSTQLK